MNIAIPVFKITILFIATIFLLTLAYVGFWHINTEYHRWDNVFNVFDFNSEGNLPSLFSFLLLLSCSVLFWLIAHVERQSTPKLHFYWKGLSFIFLFLSVDEAAGFHECLTNPFRNLFNSSGLFYYAWCIPYICLLLIFLFVYKKFLLQIDRRQRSFLILSGILYITGALGFEMLGGMQDQIFGKNNTRYMFYVTFEEALEMIGLVILNYSLMERMANRNNLVDIKLHFKH